MRILLILSLILCQSISASSQNAIAKIKYEKAEEAYEAKDYQTSLTYLNQAIDALGTNNAKLLHLQILNKSKLIYEDPAIIKSLIADCKVFLKQYSETANEDKIKEVLDIQESLAIYGNDEDYNTGSKLYEKKQFAESYSYLKKSADRGFGLALNDIGLMYLNGEGRSENYIEALTYFQKASKKGVSAAFHNIGIVYYFGGFGVDKNIDLAISYLTTATERKFDKSYYWLARCYYDKKDFKNALLCSKKVPANYVNYSNVLNYMGLIYLKGNSDIPVNHNEALQLFKQSADLGNEVAYYNVGYMYFNGFGVVKNYTIALASFQQSAYKGFNDAMEMISKIYDLGGNGIKRDKKLAKQWLEKFIAAKNKK